MLVIASWARYSAIISAIFILLLFSIGNTSFSRHALQPPWPAPDADTKTDSETPVTSAPTGASSISKTIVVGKVEIEDATWVENELSEYDTFRESVSLERSRKDD